MLKQIELKGKRSYVNMDAERPKTSSTIMCANLSIYFHTQMHVCFSYHNAKNIISQIFLFNI